MYSEQPEESLFEVETEKDEDIEGENCCCLCPDCGTESCICNKEQDVHQY
jgi:hypothetical protein